MVSQRGTVALVLCLLLAGCTGPLSPGSPPAPPLPSTDGSTGSPTGTDTAVQERTNPWNNPIVVAIENEGQPDRNFTSLVREATQYWETQDTRYLGYSVEYRVVPDAANPDLVVHFTENIPDKCGGKHGDAAGCAPVITDSRQIDRPVPIWIKVGFSDASTLTVLKHELGHSLGLTHDDPPAAVMQAKTVLYTTPQPNATERAWPWHSSDFSVYVDYSDAKNPQQARDQVQHALEYYENDAPGMPTNISFTQTDNRSRADIVIDFRDSAPCTTGDGSCGLTRGLDPDGDGALEVYQRLEIMLVNLDTDAVGWHVGYWLAFAFGAEDDSEKPPPFQDATARERRSEWWK